MAMVLDPSPVTDHLGSGLPISEPTQQNDLQALSFILSPTSHVDEPTSATLAQPDVRSDDTEEEVRPRKERRIKGRRRAINPLPHVESALRRQQELKTNFRIFARPLKLILQEMARRATEELNDNHHAHEQVREAEEVKTALQARLDDRLAHVRESDRLQRAQIEQTHEAEAELSRTHYCHDLESLREIALDSLEQDIISIQEQLEPKQDEAAQKVKLEDKRYALGRLQNHNTLYDSHLRHDVASTRVISETESRSRLHNLLHSQGLLENQAIEEPPVMLTAAQEKLVKENLKTVLSAGNQLNYTMRRRNMARLTSRSLRPLLALANATTGSDVIVPFHGPQRTSVPDQYRLAQMAEQEKKTSKAFTAASEQAAKKRPRNISHGKGTVADFTAVKMDQTMATHRTDSIPGSHLKQEEKTSPPPLPPASLADAARMRTQSMPIKPASDVLPKQQPYSENRSPHRGDTLGTLGEPYPRQQPFSEPRLPRFVFGRDLDAEHARAYSREESLRTYDHLFSLLPPGQLAPPFLPRQSVLNDRPPPASYDSFRFRTIDYGGREGQPPLPPTAQPVNHFANMNGYHNRLAGPRPAGAQPPPLQGSPIMPSPLVALPPPRGQQSNTQFSYSAPPPPPGPPMPPAQAVSHGTMPLLAPFPPSLRSPPQHPSQAANLGPMTPTTTTTTSQHGGPVLAPAAGLSRSAQPAFAQQMDRQEQNRRRNTEIFPRFRPYHGPNHS